MTARWNPSKITPLGLAAALVLVATVPGFAGGQRPVDPGYAPAPPGLPVFPLFGYDKVFTPSWNQPLPVRTSTVVHALGPIAVPFRLPANLSPSSGTEFYAALQLVDHAPDEVWAVVTVSAREPGEPGHAIAVRRVRVLSLPGRVHGLAGRVHWEVPLRLPSLPADDGGGTVASSRDVAHGELVRSWMCETGEEDARTIVCHFDLAEASVQERTW